jgi:hypothetical protein
LPVCATLGMNAAREIRPAGADDGERTLAV